MLPFTDEYTDLIYQDDGIKAVGAATAKVMGNKSLATVLRDIGLLYFLNDMGKMDWYDGRYFLGSAVALVPDDADLRFWHGYVDEILLPADDYIKSQYERCLEIVPDHPYCLIVLAINDNANQDQKAKYLDHALEVQPNNIRALMLRAELAISNRKQDLAIRLLTRVVESLPYEETGYGFMNGYVNEVFTSHASAANEKVKAADLLRQFNEPQTSSRWRWWAR